MVSKVERPDGAHPRRPDLSRQRILSAAIAEFADKGFAGARIDEIAARAEINKRMIYHYFGGKEPLYVAVLEQVYADLWQAEAQLELDNLAPREALIALVRFVWEYYLAHPEFITLLTAENMLKARHFAGSDVIRAGAASSRSLVEGVLQRGEARGVFRAGLDPVQVGLTITAICYYYLSNQATSSIVLGRKLMSKAALEARLAFNIDTVLAMVAPHPESEASQET